MASTPRSPKSVPISPRNMGVAQFQLKMSPGGLPPIIKAPVKPLGQKTNEKAAHNWNVGHDALSNAAVWLENAAKEGRRTGERNTEENVNFSGDLTYKTLRELSLPARRLVASSGALTARELRKASRHDPVLFQPLTKEERQMKEVLQLVSLKAAQKFSTIRGALRHLDSDCDGTVDRSEIRYFFRAYDFPEHVADQFFEYLDEEQKGELDYGFFVSFIRPFLEGAINGNPVTARDLTAQPGAPDSVFEEMISSVDDSELVQFDREFQGTMRIIGRKIEERFGSAQAAFRFVDGDRSGAITRSETRYFFRAFNLPQEIADKFHDAIDTNRSGEISVQEFCSCLAPYVKSDAESKKTFRRQAPETPDLLGPPVNHQSDPSKTAWMKEVNSDFRTELRKLMQDMGDKIPLKFKHVRDAFRVLDLERNGRITRSEMRAFFRGFGHPEDVADRVFDLVDQEGQGEIDFAAFMSHFDSVLGPAFRQAKRQEMIQVSDPRQSKEVNDIAEFIGEHLVVKYKTVQDAFRAVDLNKDGKLSQYEMRVFVKKFGLSVDAADLFFHALDTEDTGYVLYSTFVQLFGGIKRGKDADTKQMVVRRLT
eukprot:CAMPEP_0197660956 /NCGR_PEP_ID=MMETSP1338-20131121/51160_1 /TAXON_ID=43686 ORGANISM="Pelagodinium beii, Strain RCC1491" /NCGR_SAMPLE_ID=MMETSP1338 /ASSEMBLY_ACC=CAM_ASM_000754 /LENGTH=594 /DNA_ID=CAMNT_0043238419 /DNA_START=7 /DNA_END=1791 /DNA_ORIENTATION=-